MNLIGEKYEDLAAEYLCSIGYEILVRNYFSRFGEIDIIAKDGEYTVFVEVKFRRQSEFGHPIETITKSKQKKLMKTALVYMQEHGEDFYRFDAIVILDDKLEHIKNIELEVNY